MSQATLTILTHNTTKSIPVETVSINEFIDFLKDPYYSEGFQEIELAKKIDEYNEIVQVFQTYRVRDSDGIDEF